MSAGAFRPGCAVSYPKRFRPEQLKSTEGKLHWEVSEFKETSSKVVLVLGAGDAPQHLVELRKLLYPSSLSPSVLSIRLFYQPTANKGT